MQRRVAPASLGPIDPSPLSPSRRPRLAAAPAPPPGPTTYTAALTAAQAEVLRARLPDWGFRPLEKPYTLYAAEKPGVSLAVYVKGPKVVVQGKGTAEFVQFCLEPEVTGQARLGYEEVLHPDRYAPHFGIDESGKGDFFGPLVVAGVYVDGDAARRFVAAGVQDSKNIGSDVRIRTLAGVIQSTPGVVHDTVVIGPAAYNRLYAKMGNLNRLLGWGHARVLENLLAARPDCPRALSDQFADARVIQRALMERGRGIQLDQRTKAEADPAVAAASILARARFIDWLQQAGVNQGLAGPLPRGVSAAVKTTARRLVARHGAAVLPQLAKTHFKTAAEVLAGGPAAEPPAAGSPDPDPPAPA